MNELNMKYTGRIIKDLREKAGESQEQLAEALQAPNRETIARWENGSRDLKREHIISIAQHFNVSADYLLGLADDPSINPDMQNAHAVTGLSSEAIERLSGMQYCDFNTPYKRTDIIENIILNAHFKNLLNTLCEACLFAGAETLTKSTEYTASFDGKTINFKQLSKENLVELYSQKALKEFNIIITKMIEEASENAEHNPTQE